MTPSVTVTGIANDVVFWMAVAIALAISAWVELASKMTRVLPVVTLFLLSNSNVVFVFPVEIVNFSLAPPEGT